MGRRGVKTEARLADAGIETVGDLAALGEENLARLLGRGAGRHLYALSMARDPRRVETGRRRKSIGRSVRWVAGSNRSPTSRRR